MTTLAYRAQALGPLRAIDWKIPAGVSVVVGPNRVGKSTLLRLPELVAHTIRNGINDALKTVFEGVSQLRNLELPPSIPMRIGLSSDDIEWEVDLSVHGGRVADFPSERLRVGEERLLWREFGGDHIEGEACRYPLRGTIPTLAMTLASNALLGGIEDLLARPDLESIRRYAPPETPEPILRAAQSMLSMVLQAATSQSFRAYGFTIDHLLRYGSAHSSALTLLPTGENVFPLLRNWRDKLELEERYEFVLSTMREIFAHLGRVEFEQAGQTVTMNVSDERWPSGTKVPIARESTGFITALLQLCALASCSHGGLVTLDEIETSLHPRAIRVLVEACRSWAAKHDLRVVLATQSETVLDQFREEPSQVFVLEPQQEISPQALTDLFDPEYLSQFSLGDLFAHLEFGSDPSIDPA